MKKRDFIKRISVLGLAATATSIFGFRLFSKKTNASAEGGMSHGGAAAVSTKETDEVLAERAGVERLVLSEDEWKKRLTPEQFIILRKEGTERPFTSKLNDEKREGSFHCVGCGLELFKSEMKYDSRTGWPSFFTHIEGHFGKTEDYKLIYKRTEYHCISCGGHHGHVFNDGPPPTHERWCNNGVVLEFRPRKGSSKSKAT